MKLNRLITVVLLFAYGPPLLAQLAKPDTLTRVGTQRYIFPIFSGKTNLLAGTMGELRSTHFHAGVDIRTNNMIGIPVRAAKEGYVSRIIVGTYGYGKAIFITHPDGKQTLYAHLDKFKGTLASFVLNEHYSRRSFDLDISPHANQLKVNQGDTIALSGNTGGSQGPHLHFEIRDSANQALNPLSFNFSEIIDTFSPYASKIALTTLDSNSRINDKFGRFEFYLLKMGNSYNFSKPILAHGKIGVELLATDRMNNSGFRFGINDIEMFADGNKIFTQSIDKINFEESRGIQNIFNYKILKQRGLYFNKLYVDDGNTFGYFKDSKANGIIHIDQKIIPVRIELKDTYGNTSEVNFSLQPNPIVKDALLTEPITKPVEFEIVKNVLKVTSTGCIDTKLKIVSGTNISYQKPSYGNAMQNVYLLDLKKSMPDSIISCGRKLVTNLKQTILSGVAHKYVSERVEIDFPADALYDTLYFTESFRATDKGEEFAIGNSLVPLYKPIVVLLKPTRKYQEDKTTSVYAANGANMGGSWENGHIRFVARELGNFTIQQDLTPPTIAKIYLTQRTARFKISDNRSGIASFEATINGEWLLMEYEYKTGILQSVKKDKNTLLKGDFQLKVIDNAGNEKIIKQRIY